MESNKKYLQIHPLDNVMVALQNLPKGTSIEWKGSGFRLACDISAKHKFTIQKMQAGQEIYMYGVLVGKATRDIEAGSLINIDNTSHAAGDFKLGKRKINWEKPDVSGFSKKVFMGFHRQNGTVGTANYWIVVPMVFCENRNIEVLKEALTEKLGFKRAGSYEAEVENLVELFRAGKSAEEILDVDLQSGMYETRPKKIFENIDGIKFLSHTMGCGGTRMDSDALCGLIAGYITHPNVAGATILSLGCQHAQTNILTNEVNKRDPFFNKPLIILEQQKIGTEREMLCEALKRTFTGLMEANKLTRQPAHLSKLCIGLECGGSDGFSGISANPVLGYVSDMLVSLGGSVILSEFPELCGVEQELSDRCVDEETALKFIGLMSRYNALAEAGGSGFYANPSPGNIKDGLITDAIKSAGAAKKGGSSPVTDVLDYPQKITKPGLNLLCTPGNDVESATAEVASGANIVLFTTGLGTPTGNPVAPVIKISSNTELFIKMPDIIDINCGTIIGGQETIRAAAERILDFVIQVASGEIQPKAVLNEQEDFIPWKRGVSL